MRFCAEAYVCFWCIVDTSLAAAMPSSRHDVSTSSTYTHTHTLIWKANRYRGDVSDKRIENMHSISQMVVEGNKKACREVENKNKQLCNSFMSLITLIGETGLARSVYECSRANEIERQSTSDTCTIHQTLYTIYTHRKLISPKY